MTDVRLSVCIPYKPRLDNLGIALEALARQTMSAADFEVIIGAMEYSGEFIAACSGYRDRLNLVTVCSSREFHIPGPGTWRCATPPAKWSWWTTIDRDRRPDRACS